jgi:chemotaxis regulatin CheY-phosphate phosphatase CheZ
MMDTPLPLTEAEYLQIEDALGAKPRGRSFLRMRDQQLHGQVVDEMHRLATEIREAVERNAATQSGNPAHIRILRQELLEMSGFIQQTRAEIAAIKPDDGGDDRIITATSELDAIVSATERATSDILNAAERIQELAARLPEAAGTITAEIEDQAMEILTACSFQDITGQRTTKVVNTLRYLEQRVNSMIAIWGTDDSVKPVVVEKSDTRPDAHLLNGPALEGGVSQADVDAMLSGIAPPEADVPAAAPAAKPAPTSSKASPPLAADTPPVPPVTKPSPTSNKASPPPVAGAAASQADIDALFD